MENNTLQNELIEVLKDWKVSYTFNPDNSLLLMTKHSMYSLHPIIVSSKDDLKDKIQELKNDTYLGNKIVIYKNAWTNKWKSSLFSLRNPSKEKYGFPPVKWDDFTQEQLQSYEQLLEFLYKNNFNITDYINPFPTYFQLFLIRIPIQSNLYPEGEIVYLRGAKEIINGISEHTLDDLDNLIIRLIEFNMRDSKVEENKIIISQIQNNTPQQTYFDYMFGDMGRTKIHCNILPQEGDYNSDNGRKRINDCILSFDLDLFSNKSSEEVNKWKYYATCGDDIDTVEHAKKLLSDSYWQLSAIPSLKYANNKY